MPPTFSSPERAIQYSMTRPSFEVLLVEDDQDDYVLTREMLAEADAAEYRLDWKSTPHEGLAALKNRRYDVCLVDYRLGELTGVEFIRQASRGGASLPMVLLTGESDGEIDLDAMRAGAADFLSKAGLTRVTLERCLRYCIQQKRAEQQRIQLVQEQFARGEAEAANRAKDDFLAALSHELRTPITAVLGWLELIRKGPSAETVRSDPALHQAIEVIDRNVRAQVRLIDDLLDMSRVVTGKLKLIPRPTPLRSIVDAATDTVRPAADARRIAVDVRLADGLPEVKVDADRMQQVVWNLLTNAVKFTPEGGRIVVTAGTFLRDDLRMVRIEVSDNGRGISADFLPHVFDRFRQADTAGRHHHATGLGLGLAIVKHLVEAHGGAVRADSNGLGHGATFTVDLPVN